MVRLAVPRLGARLGWGAKSGRSGGEKCAGLGERRCCSRGAGSGAGAGAGPGGGASVGVRERLGVRRSFSRGASRGASDLSTTGKASDWAFPPPLGAASRGLGGRRDAERPSFAPSGRERGLSPFRRGLLTKSRAYSGGRA